MRRLLYSIVVLLLPLSLQAGGAGHLTPSLVREVGSDEMANDIESNLLSVTLGGESEENPGDEEDNAPIADRYVIKGVVVDESSQPLPGAVISVVGTIIGAGTDSKGEFSLSLRESGEYTLRVSYIGYEVKDVVVQANATSVDNPIRIELEPTLYSLNDVIVTGSRVERPIKDSPVLTRVIGESEIEALNPMNVETLLQYSLPGLQIGYNTMSQLPEITYQGSEGEYLLFLVDGERVSGEGADHNVDFTRFNIDDIDRIEVIKGAQSTIYGSNALGGVINIITKKANRPFTGNISARYAGSDGQKYSLSIGTKQNHFTSYTSATYRTRDTYTIKDKEGQVTYNTDSLGNITTDTAYAYSTSVYGYEIWDLTQKLGYAIRDNLLAEVKGTFYHNKRDIQGDNKYQDYFLDYALNASLKYLPQKYNQTIQLTYVVDDYLKKKDYFVANFWRTDYKEVEHTIRADYSATFQNHTLSAGAEGNFEYLKHYFFKDSGDVKMQTAAIYVQEDWKILENLDLIVGLRADYHAKYHWHSSPKISLMYRPVECLTLRAGYSQGFRSPSLKELYQEYDMGGLGWMMLYGNENLKPETSNQYLISAEVTKGIWNASVTAYHNSFENKITYELIDEESADQRYVNAEESQTTGVESILQMRLELGLTLMGSYAYVNDYEKVNGKNTSSVRPHSITFNAIYSHKFGKYGLNGSLNGQWGSKLKNYSLYSDGSYSYVKHDARTLCSLNVGASFPRGIALNFGIENLFNYKDKSADNTLQLPENGLKCVGTLNINLADLFGL